MYRIESVEGILPRFSCYKAPVPVIREDNHGCKDCAYGSVMYHQRQDKKNLYHPVL